MNNWADRLLEEVKASFQGIPSLKIEAKKLIPNAILPTYGTKGAAAMDFYSDSNVFVPAGGSAIVTTGIAIALPEGTLMQLHGRSGLAFKHDIRLANSVGIIDSDYRGEIKVKLHNDGTEDYQVSEGDRIAQGIVSTYIKAELIEATSLDQTDRGSGGFGSTGT